MDEIAPTDTLIRKTLARAGLKIELEQLALDLAFAHINAHVHDVHCAAFRSPNGSVLKLGIKIPEGQNQDKPDSVDLFVSLERGGDGRRVHKRTGHRSWCAAGWGADASPPAAIHLEQALEEIKAMARAFMAPP